MRLELELGEEQIAQLAAELAQVIRAVGTDADQLAEGEVEDGTEGVDEHLSGMMRRVVDGLDLFERMVADIERARSVVKR